MDAPKAPADIFDFEPNRAAESEAAGDATGPTASLPLGYMLLAGGVTLAVALVFRFPPWAVAGLPLAAAASQVLRDLRRIRRVAWVSTSAAVAAQITDVFVSPFGWGMRFAFFAVLFGTGVLFWGVRMDGFEDN